MYERSDFSTTGTPLSGALGRLGLNQRRLLAIWAVGLSVLFSLALPLNEVAVGWLGSWLYWLVHMAVALGVVAGATLCLGRFASRWSNWLLAAAAGACGAVLFAPFALLLEVAFAVVGWVEEPLGDGGVSLARALGEELVELVPLFTGAWLVIQAPFLLAVAPGAGAAVAEAAEAAPRPGLLGLVKPALGDEIVLMRSDLNYLHVHTRRGRTLVLYSLARAADELGDAGLLVHRSCWVAKDAVTAVRRGGGQWWVELDNGERCQVSRRRQGVVKAEFGVDFRR